MGQLRTGNKRHVRAIASAAARQKSAVSTTVPAATTKAPEAAKAAS